jgi:hypothetical protein
MIEKRKKMCMEVESERVIIGDKILQLDHFPDEKIIRIKELD